MYCLGVENGANKLQKINKMDNFLTSLDNKSDSQKDESLFENFNLYLECVIIVIQYLWLFKLFNDLLYIVKYYNTYNFLKHNFQSIITSYIF